MNADTGAAPAGSLRQVLTATVVAFASAMIVLVAFVLPAEYGVDPLGTGRLTGLLALAQPEQAAFAPASLPYVEETMRFPLEPFESVEYKYRLEAGAALTFAWRADSEVVSELHAEPDDAPSGYAESYQRLRAAGSAGSYRAEFSGWHGWFWENRGADAVTVELRAGGFFSAARIYGGGRVQQFERGPAALDGAASAVGAGPAVVQVPPAVAK